MLNLIGIFTFSLITFATATIPALFYHKVCTTVHVNSQAINMAKKIPVAVIPSRNIVVCGGRKMREPRENPCNTGENKQRTMGTMSLTMGSGALAAHITRASLVLIGSRSHITIAFFDFQM